MVIKNCRNCKSKSLKKLFSLGKLSLTGKFLKNPDNLNSDYLTLILCKKCKLVQLDRNFNMKFLYNDDYGYKSGINKTMRSHLQKTAKLLQKKSNIKKDENILDIASNDGTLLNFYGKKFTTVGVDPLVSKYKKLYKKINYSFSNFFDLKLLKKYQIFKKKFKIISALSVFYDLKNPNFFLKDVKKILHKDGIFVLEFADLYSILKFKMFDTICHEHLEYYSVSVLKKMVENNGLKIFDHEYNNINGGSSRFYICHENSKIKQNIKKIKKIIASEKISGLHKPSTFKEFFTKIKINKKKLISLIKKLKANKKTIHGYGASTKGNVLLQFFGIDNKYLDYISDRNPQKYNCFTPGTKIKIISEKKSRKLNPDYYIVLPWHFKKEIISREKKIRKMGTKLIFPLPNIEII